MALLTGYKRWPPLPLRTPNRWRSASLPSAIQLSYRSLLTIHYNLSVTQRFIWVKHRVVSLLLVQRISCAWAGFSHRDYFSLWLVKAQWFRELFTQSRNLIGPKGNAKNDHPRERFAITVSLTETEELDNSLIGRDNWRFQTSRCIKLGLE